MFQPCQRTSIPAFAAPSPMTSRHPDHVARLHMVMLRIWRIFVTTLVHRVQAWPPMFVVLCRTCNHHTVATHPATARCSRSISKTIEKHYDQIRLRIYITPSARLVDTQMTTSKACPHLRRNYRLTFQSNRPRHPQHKTLETVPCPIHQYHLHLRHHRQSTRLPYLFRQNVHHPRHENNGRPLHLSTSQHLPTYPNT